MWSCGLYPGAVPVVEAVASSTDHGEFRNVVLATAPEIRLVRRGLHVARVTVLA